MRPNFGGARCLLACAMFAQSAEVADHQVLYTTNIIINIIPDVIDHSN
jgi:hypothetical protein